MKINRNVLLALTLFIAILMIFSSALVVTDNYNVQHVKNSVPKIKDLNIKANIVLGLDQEQFDPIPIAQSDVHKGFYPAYNGRVSVMLTFSFNNQSRLVSLLSNLSNPKSAEFHKFMTRSQFAANFSVSSQIY